MYPEIAQGPLRWPPLNKRWRCRKIDSQIKRLTQERLTLFFIQGPGVAARLDFSGGGLPIGHAAQADARNLKSRLAKIDVVHYFSKVISNSLFEMRRMLFCCVRNSLRGDEGGSSRITAQRTLGNHRNRWCVVPSLKPKPVRFGLGLQARHVASIALNVQEGGFHSVTESRWKSSPLREGSG